jgi:hypothetical protein
MAKQSSKSRRVSSQPSAPSKTEAGEQTQTKVRGGQTELADEALDQVSGGNLTFTFNLVQVKKF